MNSKAKISLEPLPNRFVRAASKVKTFFKELRNIPADPVIFEIVNELCKAARGEKSLPSLITITTKDYDGEPIIFASSRRNKIDYYIEIYSGEIISLIKNYDAFSDRADVFNYKPRSKILATHKRLGDKKKLKEIPAKETKILVSEILDAFRIALISVVDDHK